jgi:hypothetical protein
MITLLAAVTLQSLLTEMTDYDAVARWPDPSYTCHQASSYDRATKTPDDQKGWFANADQNQYIRIETNQNCIEKVMMDAVGPGAIVRFWITTHNAKKGNIRIYLDGAKSPAITVPSFDFANNSALPAGNPLLTLHPGATPEARGGNTLYLPIPYAKHCKVTWEEHEAKAPRYYQINYRTYPPGTKVETFKPGNYDRANKTLAQPPTFTGGKEVTLDQSIAPGKEAALDLGGPAAVRLLELRADASCLRTLILRAEFDGKQTIWCPVGDFFGSGVGLNALDSWYLTVNKDGALTCRWVMPYQKSGKFTLLNLGKKPVTAKLTARTGDWKWDDRSMHFRASWRQQYPIPTRPMIDWNYLAATGQGIYVGDSLVVFNPVKNWWGEGDEKIYVDGETFPSHIGTGTEDYYNYSWCHTGLFQTPFANQIRCDGPRNAGYTVVNRTRSLDAIPFTKSFRFDMEVWHWGECNVGYAATTYWYARPGATCNRASQPDEAARELPSVPDTFRIAGAVECETMQIVAQTPDIPVGPQSLSGDWSGDSQLWIRGKQRGDFVELRIPATQKHKLTLYATKSWDYGILRFSVNGQPAGKDFDAWAEKPIPSGAIPLGVFEPKNGAFILRVEVVGANPKSKNSKSFFGLDAVTLTPP